MTHMNLPTKQKQKQREPSGGCQGEGAGGGIVWEAGVGRSKLSYIEWINQVPLYSTENYIQYPMINHNGKEYKTQCTCVCVCITESLCCIEIINKILYTNHTSIKKKKKR